ncbi:MAG: type II toxin-antitoxin system YoeB family toxin [Nanoarchaeota archaeon]|nr:type II toxin-antitoxin system YoeB family toxin [Nanoarchaeota archaeon]
MKLPSKVKFVNNKTLEAFEKTKTKEKRLYEWLLRAFKDIEENAFCGIQIPKRLIPKEYIKKYEITNLWKYNLPDAWRLLYSIENQEIIVVSIILEWMDHKDYERKFNY